MKIPTTFVSLLAICGSMVAAPQAGAQTLPGSLGFSISGSFVNGTAQSSNSILITDNDLSNGYHSEFDTTDAPDALSTSGPAGSAAFQWGEAATWEAYPHSSALWFQPLDLGVIAPEESFELGHLFYRNGTIKSGTGATWVDIALTLSFSQPLGLDPLSVVFGTELINTLNSSDPIASADIVSLRELAAPVNFTDAAGNRYFLELTFQVDRETIDGTLSTQDEFRVFEGSQGSATLMGRFTTDPIPEPSSMLLGLAGALLFLRRRR
ncbi:MAG: choice-of-anchor K domain-containing protein [Luteolibacter sp.]|jgi:hypothetical protein|nr:choice-of-anchor K domain-containing protein [Luteolibacter sp.]